MSQTHDMNIPTTAKEILSQPGQWIIYWFEPFPAEETDGTAISASVINMATPEDCINMRRYLENTRSKELKLALDLHDEERLLSDFIAINIAGVTHKSKTPFQ